MLNRYHENAVGSLNFFSKILKLFKKLDQMTSYFSDFFFNCFMANSLIRRNIFNLLDTINMAILGKLRFNQCLKFHLTYGGTPRNRAGRESSIVMQTSEKSTECC